MLVRSLIFLAETFVILALSTVVSSVGAEELAIPSLNALDHANATCSCGKMKSLMNYNMFIAPNERLIN